VVDLLTAWTPPDEQQDQLRQDYLAFVIGHTSAGARVMRDGDPLYRDCNPAHLTASALIVDPIGQRVLLTLHGVVGRWLQTGGHLEPADQSLPQAALREAREESGLTDLRILNEPLRLDRHSLQCKTSEGYRRTTEHLDVQFCVLAEVDTNHVRSDESLDLQWWPWSALPDGNQGADHSVAALVDQARQRLLLTD